MAVNVPTAAEATFASLFSGCFGEIHETHNEIVHVEWQIADFLSLPKIRGSFYHSPFFSFLDSLWQLKIYPYGVTSEDDDWDSVPVYLIITDSASVGAVTFKFGVKKADGSVLSSAPSIWKYESDEGYEGYGHRKMLKRSDLLEQKSQLLPSDALVLTCDLKKASPSREMNTLCAALESMLDSRMHCDVVINVNQQAFEAHRLVLGSRSSVFRAMFESDMSEKNSGVVNIEGCDPAVFKDFLHFLYTSRVAITACNVFDLYEIADKYSVEELMTYCVAFMMDHLSIDNLYSIVVLADRYLEYDLYNFCAKFFEENIRSVLSSSAWGLLLEKNHLIAKELLKEVAPKIVIEK